MLKLKEKLVGFVVVMTLGIMIIPWLLNNELNPSSKDSFKARSFKAKSELTQSWVIQLASFSQAKNADALLIKLKAAGYPAFVKASSKHLLKVFVGPQQKPQIEAWQANLKAQFSLEGKIMMYQSNQELK